MSSEVLKSKYPIVAGGFFGFIVTFMLGHKNGNDVSTSLAYASIACACFGYLMKVFVRMLDTNVQTVRVEQEEAMLARIEEEKRRIEEERAAKKR